MQVLVLSSVVGGDVMMTGFGVVLTREAGVVVVRVERLGAMAHRLLAASQVGLHERVVEEFVFGLVVVDFADFQRVVFEEGLVPVCKRRRDLVVVVVTFNNTGRLHLRGVVFVSGQSVFVELPRHDDRAGCCAYVVCGVFGLARVLLFLKLELVAEGLLRQRLVLEFGRLLCTGVQDGHLLLVGLKLLLQFVEVQPLIQLSVRIFVAVKRFAHVDPLVEIDFVNGIYFVSRDFGLLTFAHVGSIILAAFEVLVHVDRRAH
mmetsp:Transcript_66366/g.143184  ORF Transcript_66366/g.143184 Transcript_66366/m.143184 type:complete len:260 (-) Transcript_66366:67-846(-)